MESPHIPVLLQPIIELTGPLPDQAKILDCTFGCGGYSTYFLEHNAHVTAFDQDPSAKKYADQLSTSYPNQLTFIQDQFSNISSHCMAESFDVILFDIGVSSPQLDQADRGFSFMKEGPLDMRMSGQGKSAADILNHETEEKLSDIFYYYGEERASRKYARLICERRLKAPFTSTLDLADFIRQHSPPPKKGRKKVHPATLIFQALRIAVNDELNQFQIALDSTIGLLKPGGILIMVTFHSLEDRIAKQFVKQYSFVPKQSKYAPIEEREKNIFTALVKKPMVATDQEIQDNPRARSAKLRALRKN